MRRDHLHQKNWNHAIYISFLRSLFLMLMIPLVMLFAVYIGLNAKIREQTCERILETLKSGTQKMEMTFDSLDQIGYYLNENSDIIQYYRADAQSIMEDRELLCALYQKLQELDPEGRRICELIMEGKSERDIASIMGYNNQSAVNYRKQKAFDRLRVLLGDYI